MVAAAAVVVVIVVVVVVEVVAADFVIVVVIIVVWMFAVLLTVHLSIILVTDRLNAKNSCFIISLLYSSTCFEHCLFIIKRPKLYYTASGIITPVGGRPVHRTETHRFYQL